MKASSQPNSSVVAPEATLPVFRTVATNSDTEPGSTSAGPTISNSSDGVAGSAVEAGRPLEAGRAGGGASGWAVGTGIATGGIPRGGDATGGGVSVAAASGAVASGAAITNGAGLVDGGVAGIVG